MNQSKLSSKKLLFTAIFVAILLLFFNAWLLYQKISQDRQLQQQQVRITRSDLLTIDLEKQYHQALSELEQLRSSDQELNELIDKQKAELKRRKEQIDQMLASQKDLEAAREEIQQLRQQVSKFISEIEELQAENDSLSGKVTHLSRLSDSLESENLQLHQRSERMQDEVSKLATEKSLLSNKVDAASVLEAENVEVMGLMIRKDGKPVRRRFAKNVQQLKVCFDTNPNKFADKGPQLFLVRIINPSGETLVLEAGGSGTFRYADTGQELPYSFADTIDYDSTRQNHCLVWALPPLPLAPGNYTVELYNRNHLAGSGSFKLK